MNKLLTLALGALMTTAVSLSAAAPAFAKDRSPVVVELFTSQGCSSCPPAEAYMRELAKRDDVIGLEFHVDYWDYIGWKDKFAQPAFTQRQKRYVQTMSARYAYTPQMVINGKTHVVGSHRSQVEAIIRSSQASEKPEPPLTLRRDGMNLIVSIGAGQASGAYDVTFVTFDKPHVTKVKRGENRGRTLVNANVVRELAVVGSWSGKPTEFTISLEGKDGNGGCAVIIQKRGPGTVLAAASMPFDQ